MSDDDDDDEILYEVPDDQDEGLGLEIFEGGNEDFAEFIDDNPFDLFTEEDDDDNDAQPSFFLPLTAITDSDSTPLTPPPTIKDQIQDRLREILTEAKDLKVPSAKLEKMCRPSWIKLLTNIGENLDLRRSDPEQPFFPDPFTSSGSGGSTKLSDLEPMSENDSSDETSNPEVFLSILQSLLQETLASRGESSFPLLEHSFDSASEIVLDENLDHCHSIRSVFQDLNELITVKAEQDCLSPEEKAEIRRLQSTLEGLYSLNVSLKKCIESRKKTG